MKKTRGVDQAMVKRIAKDIFEVVPMLRKRLFRLDSVQAEHGIPLSHVQVLAMLSQQTSMSVSEISRKLGIAKPNITPLVDRLISVGLVNRLRDNEDRRVVNVVILEAGRAKLKAIQESICEQVEDWGESISSDDFAKLADALSTITRIMGEVQK